MQSLVLGGVIGALGGMILTFDANFVNSTYFFAQVTFYCYTVVILGGRARVMGPIVGAVIFWFLFQLVDGIVRQAIGAGWISESLIAPSDIGAVQNAVVGIGLLLLVVFRPQGILGRRSELLLDER